MTETAKLFRVRVDCWYEDISNNRRAKVKKRVVRWILASGATADAAMKTAQEYSDKSAPMFGGHWLAFELREAQPVTVPCDLGERPR